MKEVHFRSIEHEECGVNRDVVGIFSLLEVGIYHASTEIPPMYLMVLTIRTKYALNFYVSINNKYIYRYFLEYL